MVFESCLLRAIPVGFTGRETCERAHCDSFKVRQSAKPSHHFIPVYSRQPNVAQYNLRPESWGCFQGSSPRSRQKHFVSLKAEQHAQGIARIDIVFNNQNSQTTTFFFAWDNGRLG